MAKYVCSVCGYVHEGDAAPENCPVCKVPASKFNIMQEGAALAAEHEYGVYGKTVKNNPDISEEDKKYIFEQLMANFNGECAALRAAAKQVVENESCVRVLTVGIKRLPGVVDVARLAAEDGGNASRVA